MKLKDVNAVSVMKVSTVLLALLLIVGLISVAISLDKEDQYARHCREKGGAWFHSERLCLKVETIPVK